MITDPLPIFLILAAVVFVAVRLENRFRLFRSLGAALTGILLGMAGLGATISLLRLAVLSLDGDSETFVARVLAFGLFLGFICSLCEKVKLPQF